MKIFCWPPLNCAAVADCDYATFCNYFHLLKNFPALVEKKHFAELFL